MTQSSKTVVRGARWKSALLTAFAVPMAWGFSLVDLAEVDRFGAFFAEYPFAAMAAKAVGVGLFALGGLMSAVQLVKPARLELDAQGVHYRNSFGRDLRVAWRDVESFVVWRVPTARTATLVGFNYRPGRAPKSRFSGLNKSLGVDAAFPGGWTMSNQRLVDLLNEHRIRSAA